ncbi:MAG TPA: hypothetical protein P5114_11020 [Hyphomicrobiaceae bacterium]|nr:hypothetical protein [Hyphomicrobiaceae bacterium]
MRSLAGRGFIFQAGAIILACLFASSAHARSLDHGRWKRGHASGERHKAPPPRKDCTRINGRWGYYGNPWCSPAEQRAFDIWDAQRIERLRRGR